MNEFSNAGGARAGSGATAEAFGRRMATGSLLTGVVRVVVIPLGLVAALFMARLLGPSDLGVFAVASSVIWWAQQTLNAFFSRTTIKLVAEASEWEAVATALVQLNFFFSLIATGLLLASAPFLANLFNAPALTNALQLYVLALPILSLTQAFENVVIARRAFGTSAFFPLFFNGSRSAFILLLVGIGWGLTGAIIAQIVAAFVELTYARFVCRTAVIRHVSYPIRRMLHYSAPMFVEGLGKQINPRVDLWSVQVFVGSTASGYYSAAQSALSPLTSISTILSPLLLSTLTHAIQQGQADAARTISRHVLRLLFCLLPFIALFAGAAAPLVTLVFGKTYLPAAPLLAWLSFGIFANFVLAFTAVTLAALNRPGAIAVFTLPMLAASVSGSLLLVPQIGAIGAATTTMLTQWGAMIASLWLLHRRAQIAVAPTILLRVIPLASLAFAMASVWQAPGLFIIPQLGGLGLVVLSLLFALRLVTRHDLAFLRSLVQRPTSTQQVAHTA